MQKKSSQKRQRKKSVTHIKKIAIAAVIAVLFFVSTVFFLQKEYSVPTCANSKSCQSDLSQHIDNTTTGTFHGKSVLPPKIDLADNTPSSIVLGSHTPTGEKHIYIDLSTQTLYAYQGKTLILKTLISSGKWGRTPTGNFHIWEKLRATRMAGGEGDDAYDLPNVPYVMYFYNDFGLHGAYWHDNFGHPMSHGCINMRQIDAKALFEWADGPSGSTPGTAVSVCDQMTKSNQCIQNNPIQS